MTILPSDATFAESLWPFAARERMPETNSWSSSFLRGNFTVPVAEAKDNSAKESTAAYIMFFTFRISFRLCILLGKFSDEEAIGRNCVERYIIYIWYYKRKGILCK